MTTVTYTVPAISTKAAAQIYTFEDGKWFHITEEVVTKNNNRLDAGTALYIMKTSATQWFLVSDGTSTWEISRLTPAVLQG